MEWWNEVKEWFLSLGEKYHVDPLIFGAIYVGAIPFFLLSLSWLIRNLRRDKSIVVPVLLTGFFFISAYLYLRGCLGFCFTDSSGHYPNHRPVDK